MLMVWMKINNKTRQIMQQHNNYTSVINSWIARLIVACIRIDGQADCCIDNQFMLT